MLPDSLTSLAMARRPDAGTSRHRSGQAASSVRNHLNLAISVGCHLFAPIRPKPSGRRGKQARLSLPNIVLAQDGILQRSDKAILWSEA